MFVGHNHTGSSAKVRAHSAEVGGQFIGKAPRNMAVFKNHSLSIGDGTRSDQIKIEPGHRDAFLLREE
jgi:hypothetical protein